MQKNLTYFKPCMALKNYYLLGQDCKITTKNQYFEF